MSERERFLDRAMSMPNAAANAIAIRDAVTDRRGGGWFTRLASIPGRRLRIGMPEYAPPTASAPDPAAAERARADAAAAATAAMTGGFAWNPYDALPAGLRAAVPAPATFTVVLNQALREGPWAAPAVQRQLEAFFTARPDVAAAAAAAALLPASRNDIAASHAAINGVVQDALRSLREASPARSL